MPAGRRCWRGSPPSRRPAKPGWGSGGNQREAAGGRGTPGRAAFSPERAGRPAAPFRPPDSSVAFAASTSPEQLLGCDIDALPPLRDGWLSLTFNRFPILAPAVPDDPNPPAIPALD